MRGQAALQGVYNPDRIKTPLVKVDGQWRPIAWKEAEALARERLTGAASDGAGNVFFISEVAGETTLAAMQRFQEAMAAAPPVLFEPFGYEALKAANAVTFGLAGLCRYRIDQADVLVGFGADFLETWLSPVEYSRKFKEMHGYRDGRKGLFFHVGPYESVTAANADHWLPVSPGAEAVIAMGCLHEALAKGRGDRLPSNVREAVHAAAAPYTEAAVCSASGVDAGAYRTMVKRLLAAERPLVLGQGVGGGAGEGLAANIAANLLNLVLDPDLARLDFIRRHRVEIAHARREVYGAFREAAGRDNAVLLLNNVNPVYSLPASAGIRETLERSSVFTISFSNFMDDTAVLADLILPTRLPLERWGEYAGHHGIVSTLQPAMGRLTDFPDLCDLLVRLGNGGRQSSGQARKQTYERLRRSEAVTGDRDWINVVQQGGVFTPPEEETFTWTFSFDCLKPFSGGLFRPVDADEALCFAAAPSLRFFDGRGGNRSWLAEFPDPITKVAWQAPVWIHPDTMTSRGLKTGDLVEIASDSGRLIAPVYPFAGLHPKMLVMTTGQGHAGFGRYAKGRGANPFQLLPAAVDPVAGGPGFLAAGVKLAPSGKRMVLAHTDGSKFQHGRKIAMSVAMKDLHGGTGHDHHGAGFGMHEFPMNLPLPEGYDPHQDVYPPHEHRDDYRWGMVVDLDRCIGCGACSVACYAENNIGVVGEQRVIEGREMSWIHIERYHDPDHMEKMIFLPMMCQHCDNAPCESVCPVYAPHHGKEGLNNQIYNRCIGTRYCVQNCPYKVRRFNWFEWDRPHPLPLQLNPDVTVRMRGVMEKCSFCVQRIKEAHGWAKNENRRIRDGEMVPACVQTCPTDALVFGNLADKESRVRRMVEDPRAYQVMGYLNTKPAVIYLRKVVQEI
jgi:molybdopterin-containing oxidoreductase family iron-sulfur binding subunit